MKLKAAEIDRVLHKPGKLAAALIYGPDAGLVSERAQILSRAIVDDLSDAFRVCGLSETDIKSDPARLVDEAAAISMLGGRRLIRLRINGDSTSQALQEFDVWAGETEDPDAGFLIVEAGDLGPRSSVRKLFEASKMAAAIPCYADDAGAIERVIDAMLREGGWRAPPETMAYLVSHLGNDRQITRQEISKLLLYLGPGNKGSEVTLEQAQDAIGDASALTVDGLIDAVASGDVDDVDKEILRCFESGQTPVGLIRAASSHFMRLAKVVELQGRGESADSAIGKLRPPVHFKRKRRFAVQTGVWRGPLLAQAIDLLLAAEAQCKVTGNPDTLICSDAFVRLSVRARATRQRR